MQDSMGLFHNILLSLNKAPSLENAGAGHELLEHQQPSVLKWLQKTPLCRQIIADCPWSTCARGIFMRKDAYVIQMMDFR
jgi:hypothetical protein